jgi:hypothetical protein
MDAHEMLDVKEYNAGALNAWREAQNAREE